MNELNVKLYWWRGSDYNFGDEITPWLFNKMFDINVNMPCNITREKSNILISTGSIMRLSSPKVKVWGSGIRNIDQSDFTEADEYCAVRGMFSRFQLMNLGFNCPDTYGDPGLLLPKYYNPKVKKEYKLGIIPHVSEYDDIVEAFSDNDDILIIDLATDDIEIVIDEILSCESTVSTSLHGVITSVAYDIPTRWVKFSNRINGDDIKFYDFFSSIDPDVFLTFDFKKIKSTISKYNPIPFTTNVDLLFKSTFKYDKSKLDLNKLIESCPIK